MKTSTIDLRRYFSPVFGTSPWRVKLGVGSFLTFEFGPRVRANHHIHGKWHLWIYLSNWKLSRRERPLVDSDSDRRGIEAAARRLEGLSFTDIKFQNRSRETAFLFGDFRLVVSPADYIENPDSRDYFWMFFMPDDEVLTVGPSGIQVEQGIARPSSADGGRQEVETHATVGRRQIRLED